MKKLLEDIAFFLLRLAGTEYYLPCKSGQGPEACLEIFTAQASVRENQGTPEERYSIAIQEVAPYIGKQLIARHKLNRMPAEHATELFEIQIYTAATPAHSRGGFEYD